MFVRSRLLTSLLFTVWLASLFPAPIIHADHTPPPETVTIPGTLQSELGCSGDWQPECDKTFLTYDPEDDVWQGEFNIQPNDDQDKNGPRYKAALNKSWGENYGAKAALNGPDIPLVVTQPTLVKFYYDHKTHWVTDNFNQVIAVALGTFQSELGCQTDNDPGCLRSWLQDPEGTSILSFVTTAIPPGDYEVNVAINESTDETYGEGGAPGGAAIPFSVKEAGGEVYFGYNPVNHEITISTEDAPRGNLGKAQAHWVNRDTLVWNVIGSPKYVYELHYSPTADLKLEVGQITGGEVLPLTFTVAGPGQTVLQKFPHLAGYTALRLSANDIIKVPDILRGQVAVAVRDDQGKFLDATLVQIPGVLDDLYTYNGPLGVAYEGEVPTLRVWAPTAKSVTLHLFDDSVTTQETTVLMSGDANTGVWSVVGTPDWTHKYYLYEVEVFVPSTGKVEHNLVTDPYSFSLSMNSQRSQIVNLDDSALMPAGWADTPKPPLDAPEDAVIYELHIRDFSVHDPTVPEDLRGTFKAFSVFGSDGMKHLKSLAEAGLTHVHLLPAFDIASVDEDKSTWKTVDEALLATYPPDSDKQQEAVKAVAAEDGFNWGYDPYHYTTPEGSYSTNPDGSARIREFREMVRSLNTIGLRVVMDVVYNHTSASGQNDKSVLDKIVPGYYYRLNGNGQVETSTCCQNTATEHNMMEKLMIDSVLTWATAYKVDGFRFDLMGHHMLSNMVRLRAALDALTPEKDGVDGKSIYVYGEGWDFGEVAGNRRGVNATQLNISRTGIGVFNDRLRDGVRGGTPFDDPRLQGFVTGLYLAPNASETRDASTQKAKLLEYSDWIRIGLAGNLRTYPLVSADGSTVSGEQIQYGGAPVGYTLDPQENIVYVSAHDNETLFDAIQFKAPASAALADRVRMNNLAVSMVMLSQGVPFFHAGDDLLRSKSLDRNSYNSGDWFNKLDFTYQDNNFGVGLPVEGGDRWPMMKPLLSDSKLKPTPADILSARDHFREMLQIRQSSPLFRLRTAADIHRHLTFLNIGPDQIPGLIVMNLMDTEAVDLDPNYEHIVVLFNANPDEVTFTDIGLDGPAFELHPVQQASADPLVKASRFDPLTGTFAVPGRTVAVFVLKQTALEPTPTLTATATAQPTLFVPTLTPEPPRTATPTLPPPTLTPTSAPPLPEDAPPTSLLLGIGGVAAAILGVLLYRQWRARKGVT